MLAAMRAFGAATDDLEAADARRDDHDFEVWEENWPVVLLFLSLGRQWRWLPLAMGPPIRLGLDYTAVESVFRLTGVRKKERAETFAALQLMESAVIEVEAMRAARR